MEQKMFPKSMKSKAAKKAPAKGKASSQFKKRPPSFDIPSKQAEYTSYDRPTPSSFNAPSDLSDDSGSIPLDDNKSTNSGEQKTRNHEFKDAVKKALESGTSEYFGRGKLMLVGQGRAGKTTTLRSLLAKPFEKNQQSTVGAATSDMAVTVDTQDVRSWQETTGAETEMARALCATAVNEKSSNSTKRRDSTSKTAANELRVSEAARKEDKNSDDLTNRSINDEMKITSELEKAVTELTLHAEFEDVDENGKPRVTFKIFDLGGQPTFYIFHPFFLTKYAIYIVVFSMADIMHKNPLVQEETWEFLEHWLGSIYLYAKTAPIFMVGTHGDKISSHGHHEEMSAQIFKHFSNHPAFQQIVFNDSVKLWFWPVDNTKSIQDPQVANLRDSIMLEACQQDYVRMQVPLAWLGIYDRLVSLHKKNLKPVMRIDEIRLLAGDFGLSEQEIVACMHFWHEYGMVLFYDSVPGMENIVILSPQWAVDIMCKVIRDFDLHTVMQDRKARKFNREWKDLTRKGVLHTQILDLLWENLPSDLYVPFLDLMMRFGLCVTYHEPIRGKGMTVGLTLDNGEISRAKILGQSIGESSDDAVQGYQTSYLVPAILPLTLDQTKLAVTTLSSFAGAQLNKYNSEEYRAVYICFSLNDFGSESVVRLSDLKQNSFVPEGLFSRVVAHLVGSSQFTMTTRPRLSRTRAEAYFHDCKVDMSLVPQVGGIQVLIDALQPRPLLRMVQDTIVQAVQQHYDELRCYTLVPFSNDLLLFLEDVIENHRHRHSMWVNTVQVDPVELEQRYEVWLPNLGLRKYYDTFLSYRQAANSAFVVNLHVALEQSQLITFLDANNLETGLNFKIAFMEAISRSLVACPVISVGAIERLFTFHRKDYCDNVLLEWRCMLELLHYVQNTDSDTLAEIEDGNGKNSPTIFLRRIAPLILSKAWHNSHIISSTSFPDTFADLRELCNSLPDIVSQETHKHLTSFFVDRLHIHPPKERTVRETVLELLDMDGIFCWEVERVDSWSHQSAGRVQEQQQYASRNKLLRLHEYADEVRHVVGRAKQHVRDDATVFTAIDRAMHASTSLQEVDQPSPKTVENSVPKQKEIVSLSKSVEKWTEDDVVAWLFEENFDSLESAFRREHIDGLLLTSLTDDMLENELGLDSRIQRIRFFQRRLLLQKRFAKERSEPHHRTKFKICSIS